MATEAKAEEQPAVEWSRPTPWRVEKQGPPTWTNECWTVRDAYGYLILATFDKELACLVAAAPEMYGALCDVLCYAEYVGDLDSELDGIVRAASSIIVRTEGRL